MNIRGKNHLSLIDRRSLSRRYSTLLATLYCSINFSTSPPNYQRYNLNHSGGCLGGVICPGFGQLSVSLTNSISCDTGTQARPIWFLAVGIDDFPSVRTQSVRHRQFGMIGPSFIWCIKPLRMITNAYSFIDKKKINNTFQCAMGNFLLNSYPPAIKRISIQS